MTLENIIVNKMTVYEMPVDKIPVDEMTKIILDGMTLEKWL